MRNIETAWRSPSNIALIKYWGKYEPQLPANPSLSFTLKECFTETSCTINGEGVKGDLALFLNGERHSDFEPKIRQFIERLGSEASFLNEIYLRIDTRNSFPHSSGIASSASGMSALALCLLELKMKLESIHPPDFKREASRWARLGSGSASRSVYGGLVLWGETEALPQSHDEFAVPYSLDLNPVFEDFCDYILLVEKGQKSVSSSAGHGLMNGHPFAEARFAQAHNNLEKLNEALASGDLETFGEITEREALTLHALMMSSQPSYLLMKPNTLAVIEKIRLQRKKADWPMYFTLDAGANVHLLFPASFEQEVNKWVRTVISGFLKHGEYICDRVGPGPENLRDEG